MNEDNHRGHGSNSGPRHGQEWRPWNASKGRRHEHTDLATEAAEFLEALVTGAFVLIGWFVRHPVPSLLVAAVAGLYWLGGPVVVAAVALAVLTAGLLWRWRAPASFDRRCWRHIRAGLLRMWVYEVRWPRWARSCRLVVMPDHSGEEIVPRLRSVTSGPSWDEVRIRMVAGQTQRDYEHAAEALAQARKVARCAVREVSPGVISLGFSRRDALAAGVTNPPIPPASGQHLDLARVPIGAGEYGQPWRVPISATHLFGAGMTGSGKGSVLWGIVRQVAPAIRAGRVRLHMIDPKGGMEAEMGADLYSTYARDEPADVVEVLTARVDAMSDRKNALRGHVRRVDPSTEYPLDLLVVDELAALTKYLGDKKRQGEAERLLGLLLTQGRALEQLVHAYVQEPTKEIVPFRALFPYRVGLRLDSPMQTDMVLGDGAWERGAWCDRIAPSQPGVAYVVEEGVREPQRVRAGFTSDNDIRSLARSYSPGKSD